MAPINCGGAQQRREIVCVLATVDEPAVRHAPSRGIRWGDQQYGRSHGEAVVELGWDSRLEGAAGGHDANHRVSCGDSCQQLAVRHRRKKAHAGQSAERTTDIPWLAAEHLKGGYPGANGFECGGQHSRVMQPIEVAWQQEPQGPAAGCGCGSWDGQFVGRYPVGQPDDPFGRHTQHLGEQGAQVRVTGEAHRIDMPTGPSLQGMSETYGGGSRGARTPCVAVVDHQTYARGDCKRRGYDQRERRHRNQRHVLDHGGERRHGTSADGRADVALQSQAPPDLGYLYWHPHTRNGNPRPR